MKLGCFSPAARVALAILVLCLLYAPSAPTQTLTVIHNFGGPTDGAYPLAGVISDAQGSLYGTTRTGGLQNCNLTGCGTVFQLTPTSGGNWSEQVLTRFEAQDDYGGFPAAPVVLDRLGNVYGTYACAFDCGFDHGGGIFELVRGSDGTWTDWTLAGYWESETGPCNDGECSVAFDHHGRLYGAVDGIGGSGGGALLYLGQRSLRSWYTIYLHTFGGGHDGLGPSLWFTFDAQDSIYGTTSAGGATNAGTVYELRNAGGALWTETQLYVFQGGTDGSYPYGGVIFDSPGNLYGTTALGGIAGAGTVFKLTRNSNGTWSESTLYTFQGGSDAAHAGPLIFDATGNLYGVAAGGAFGHGAVFKLTPSAGGQWTESVVYSFTGGLDGDGPSGGLALDNAGNLYGTTARGGAYPTCSEEPECGGVVYKLTP